MMQTTTKIRLHSDAVVNNYVNIARNQIYGAVYSKENGPLANLHKAAELQKIATETIMKEKRNRSLVGQTLDENYLDRVTIVSRVTSNLMSGSAYAVRPNITAHVGVGFKLLIRDELLSEPGFTDSSGVGFKLLIRDVPSKPRFTDSPMGLYCDF